ncbi:MAG: hypothetical protein NC110_08100 [Ruminococcus sp.]|nr:hypothetical protein [Ruminococcus sp.]
MAYADHEFYKYEFYGDTLNAECARKWLSLASDEIDAITHGRLIHAFPEIEHDAVKVKKAVCAVAEALYCIDIQRKATSAQKSEDGTYKGAVSSISSGRESISYNTSGGSGSVYSAAAADVNEQAKLINSIAVKYLANVPDANGVNLLYAGEVHHVPKHDYCI